MSGHELAPLPVNGPQLPDLITGSHETEAEFNIGDYIGLLRRRWRLLVVGVLVGAVVGGALYATTPRIYQARARIQIERRAMSPLNSQGTNWLEAWWNPEYYPTQFEILKSRGLAEEVIVRYRLLEDPDFNPAAAHGGGASLTDPIQDDEVGGKLASRLLSGLTVRPKVGTQLVDILYSSPDPALAMKLANAFAETFRQRGIEDRTRAAGRASSFLAEQIDQIKSEIDLKETQLRQFSRDRDFVPLSDESNTTLQRLEAINQAYVKARSDRILKEVRYNELLSSPAAAETRADSTLQSIRTQLMELEREYASKLEVYKPSWPAMVELQQRIEALRQQSREIAEQALDSARIEYQSAIRAEVRLESELERIKQESLELDSHSVEVNNLRVEISTRRELLDELVRRQSETSVAQRGSSEPNVHIIEKALLPGRPSEPNLKSMVSTSAGVGFLLAIGLVLFLDFVDRTIKSPEELEKRLHLPVLAVIPDISAGSRFGYLGRYGYGYGYGYGRREKRRGSRTALAKRPELAAELVPQLRPRLAISESYRSLRTALLLSSADKLQVITITSATSGEGKTVTAANLAIVLAQLGKRVLLVDADLRKPRVHKVFRLPNRVGVVTHIVGQAALEEILLTNGVPNLCVVPSGPIPPNPSELLSSSQMTQFIDTAREIFDYIVIDTPPTLAVTDSTVMGSISDGVVLCVRARAIPREDARLSADRLRMAGVKILGTVLNCYRPLAGHRSSDYYYYYYQAYAEDQESV